MRRRAFALAVLVVITAGLIGLPKATAAPPGPASWVGSATMVAGTARYDQGEWIYNDFVYDDYGADTGSWGQPNVVSLAGASGDARYPTGPEFAGNAADIVEVRARSSRANREDLDVRVTLQTIVAANVPAIWVRSGAAEHVFTVRNATVDPRANTVEFTLPRGATGNTAALSIGAGLHDGTGGLRPGVPGNNRQEPGDYTTGGPTDNRLFDVAFNSRSDEPRGGPWNEDAQSDALAAGDLSAFVETIDITALRRRARTTLDLRPGYYVRLFRSRQELGEGIRESFPQYAGKFQPYALWVPDSYRPGRPTHLLLSLHSLSVHHNQYRGGTSPTYSTYYEQLGDGLDAVVVTPLGRGPDGWYLDEAFVDTLEVWSDALATFPSIDREKSLVTGYSMGGYGTYRFSTLAPDSFASAVSVVGPPTSGIWTGLDMPADDPYFTYPQLENTRHVPFWITQGVLDELVPAYGVTRQAQRFGELGHEYRFSLHPGEDHLSFSVKDDWSREAAWFAGHPARTTSPRDVTLRVRPASLLSPDRKHLVPLLSRLLDEVGAQVDGAYWVRDVVVAGAKTADVTGAVNLTSHGIARTRGAQTAVQGAGVDGPSPYVLTGNDVARAGAAREPRLTGSLAGVAALTIDLQAAGLSRVPDLGIATDRQVTITFVVGNRVAGTRTLPAPPPR
ncbi:MAG TPA: hypothetical protein VM030_09090 [Acidimicrobiales bacterium]|nr:hypothetical protein [Acidimicrobiales bacterium]